MTFRLIDVHILDGGSGEMGDSANSGAVIRPRPVADLLMNIARRLVLLAGGIAGTGTRPSWRAATVRCCRAMTARLSARID